MKVPVALLLLLALAGAVSADNKVRVFGDSLKHPSYPNEFIRTYVDMPKKHTTKSKPLAVGVQITYGFSEHANELPATWMMIKDGGVDFNLTSYEVMYGPAFPRVGTNPFKFLYLSYNQNGHPPPGVYDVPHYDFHFMFDKADDWWTNQYPTNSHGPCFGGNPEVFYNANKPMPIDCWPGPVDRIAHLGNFVWGMGTHLYDLQAPEIVSMSPFNYTHIWGVHNGEVAYMEPMFARAITLRRDYKACIDLSGIMPRLMPVARTVPHKLCFLSGNISFKIEFSDFKTISAGCNNADLNSPLVGWWPTGAPFAPPLPPGCTVPTKETYKP